MTARDYALVVGEALVDIVERSDGSSEIHPGGSPANVAFGLGRLGRAVRLVTQLGDDEHGRLIRRHLSSAAVSVDGGPVAGPTASARALLDAAGAARYSFDLRWTLDGGLDGGTRPGAGSTLDGDASGGDTAPLVVHAGSIAAVLEPGAAAVARLIESARPASTVTFDPNIRPALIHDRPAALARIGNVIRLADVVKASNEDLEWIAPGVTAETTAGGWLAIGESGGRPDGAPMTGATGPALVVITRGREGSTALTRAARVDLPAHPGDVVDTIGAGDAFTSALIDALWDEGLLGAAARPRLRTIGDDALGRILRRASAAAAITVSRPGASPPTRAELG